MHKGFYRSYFHIGSIGFKVARISFNDGNPFIGFIISCIMNYLEWKRYRYYCKGKKFRQWGRKWRHEGEKPMFCPVYFSCGLFSIVKHLDKKITAVELLNWVKSDMKSNKITYGKLKNYEKLDEHLNHKTLWMCRDIKEDNFRIDSKTGKIYCIDYAYFTIGNTHAQCACLIDYK